MNIKILLPIKGALFSLMNYMPFVAPLYKSTRIWMQQWEERRRETSTVTVEDYKMTLFPLWLHWYPAQDNDAWSRNKVAITGQVYLSGTAEIIVCEIDIQLIVKEMG